MTFEVDRYRIIVYLSIFWQDFGTVIRDYTRWT
jgi:hypothetical protein